MLPFWSYLEDVGEIELVEVLHAFIVLLISVLGICALLLLHSLFSTGYVSISSVG